MNTISELTERLSYCRNFTEICQLVTTFPLTDTSFSGALIASLDADARIRELGRFGVAGTGPSKESVALSGDGLIAKAMQSLEPVLKKFPHAKLRYVDFHPTLYKLRFHDADVEKIQAAHLDRLHSFRTPRQEYH